MNLAKSKIKPFLKYIFAISMMFSHLGFAESIDADPASINYHYYLGFIYILIIYPINEFFHWKKIIKSFEIQAVLNIVAAMVLMTCFKDVVTITLIQGVLTALLFLLFGQGIVNGTIIKK